MEFSVENIRKDFPVLNKVVYLDSAATSQMPLKVIEVMEIYYKHSRANVGRGLYNLAIESTERYKRSRERVAEFVGTKPGEIIFTKGATDSLNLLARGLGSIVKKKGVLISEMEHHSNLVPWQRYVEREEGELKFLELKDYKLDLDRLEEKLEGVGIVSISHVSNVLGVLNDVKEIVKRVKKKNREIIVIVDAAQSVGKMKVDFEDIGCDFLVFSGHKIGGPFGVGVLCGKKEILERMGPDSYGGGMVSDVGKLESKWVDLPERFEAGTQNISGVIGLAETVDYLDEIGVSEIENWIEKLSNYLLEKLGNLDWIEMYSKNGSKGIVSFNIRGVHSHDVSSILNDSGVCVRAGHHCCKLLMESLGLNECVRASLSYYNNYNDVDRLVESLNKVKEVFGING